MTPEGRAVAALARALADQGLEAPEVAVVLGSGLEAVGELLPEAPAIPFAGLPGLPPPRVAGHPGRIRHGRRDGVALALVQGRLHLHEGRTPAEVVRLPRALAWLGCGVVVLTNAAGGIREDLPPGSIVLLADHVNLQGTNPFVGPWDSGQGPPFPDQTRVYDPAVRAALKAAAGGACAEGVYLATLGPLYETPAEIRLARLLGADLVGMSTVQEAAALAALGVAVGGVSVVANRAAGLAPGELAHGEVLAEVAGAAGAVRALLAAALPALGALGRACFRPRPA